MEQQISKHDQQAEKVEQVDLSVEEFSIVDLDDRLELAFRCDIKLD
jgi:hypothetical protein